MFRIGLISRWHPHSHQNDQRYLKEFLGLPDCEVTCVWDEDPEIAKAWGEEWNVDVEESLESLLSREDVDGVLVTSCPTDHKEILIAAAEHKKHIFTEKVLSFSMEDAYEIRDAVKKNGIKFCISFNRLAIKQFYYAKKLLDEGTLGTPIYFRCMCGHDQGYKDMLPEYWYDPVKSGGGAMIDLGFNSTYLARYIMGEFDSVSSSFAYDTIHKPVEDTASCNVKFKNGAMGLLEATYVSPLLSVFELAVYGTEGSYYARFGGNDTAELRLAGKDSEILSLDDLEIDIKTPVATWVDAVVNGASDELYGIDAAVDMVNFMVAAYQSHEENGKRIQIND
ncbi:MAG: Gfo/Idh/MocA family oxidoreductase [Clostridia bacterium]|nr:Gfo/Idh/MocA family oxidoreductase [Clostridia bacterium]